MINDHVSTGNCHQNGALATAAKGDISTKQHKPTPRSILPSFRQGGGIITAAGICTTTTTTSSTSTASN